MDKNESDKYNDSQKNYKEHRPNEESDFFSQLQENEREKGKKARGKGHGWTTFAEVLMSDW